MRERERVSISNASIIRCFQIKLQAPRSSSKLQDQAGFFSFFVLLTLHFHFVCICMAGIKDLVSGRLSEDKVRALDLSKWDEADHLVQGNDLSVQYLLVVDAINFCFWPDGTLEYEHISGNLKKAVEANPESISAKSLCAMTGERLRGLLAWPVALPQEEERARLLREVGHSLREDFGGEAANMVRAAEHSASRLVTLVTRHFPGFRDSCVYKGRQVFLYKRYVMIDCNAMQLFLLLLLSSLSLSLSL